MKLEGGFIMSVFDNLTRRVSDTAKAAAKKSSELVEVTKLNMNIGSEEDKIEKLYGKIGKMIYERYGAEEEVDDELRELCDKISAHMAGIGDMREKILELKKVKKCPNCNAEIEIAMAFCPRCGTKQEIPQPKEETSEADEEAIVQKTCPDCGAKNSADASFCNECGAKL
jgi:ribosomal protein L40E